MEFKKGTYTAEELSLKHGTFMFEGEMKLDGDKTISGISFHGPLEYQKVEVTQDVIMLKFSKPVE